MKVKILLSAFLLFAYYLPAQQNPFTLEEYKQFLNTHQNMSSQQLLQMHDAGIFNLNINQNLDNVLYYDSICTKYNLTEYEKSLVQNHGFMVSERLSYPSFGDALKDVFYKDLPVFVSTDAILHAVHKSYDGILLQIETVLLIEKLKTILNTMYGQIPVLDAQYGSNPKMIQSLKDLDIYVSIPRRLLGLSSAPYYTDNIARYDSIYNFILSEQVQFYSLFGEDLHYIDFSQFIPRGHYNDPENVAQFPDLPKYFKAMIWLGRTEIYLLPLGYRVATHNYRMMRSTVLAALVHKAAKSTSAYQGVTDFDRVITYLIGDSDNVTLFNMNSLLNDLNITDPVQLTDTTYLQAFQDSLVTRPFAFQSINSQFLESDPFTPDSIIPASAFMLMGQKFIIDSYITSQVVYDRISYNGQKVRRMLPSTLDVLFGLGNDAAGQLLKPELEIFNYSTNLAVLRYLIDAYDTTTWNKSLFNIWLNSIRSLNPPAARNSLPLFMRTAAWWQEKMNTQLGSWTELRHDNLLYAKQSYTGIIVCSFPYSYVEPYPDFYYNLKVFGQNLKTLVTELNLPGWTYLTDYCNHLSATSDTLMNISLKELNNTSLTTQETNFLKSMLREYNDPYTGQDLNGWYYNLYYMPIHKFTKQNYIVADIHTALTDSLGGMVGWVKHVGTGPINLGTVIVENPQGQKIAYCGAFYSYYDYTTTNLLRLTDQQWDSTYRFLALRPDFVNLYLANGDGETRGQGGNLITSISRAEDKKVPESFSMLQNYPNPFNSSTVINFGVPASMTNQAVEINIYDIQGRLVKSIVKEALPAGNYLYQWNGVNNNNVPVASGVYILRGKMGASASAIKLILMK